MEAAEDGSTFPIKHAFLERVNVTNKQNHQEGNHGAKNCSGIFPEHLLVNDSPWVEENNLNIEEDEEHRHEIKFHGEPGVAFADGEHAAFIGGVFDGGAFACFAEDY